MRRLGGVQPCDKHRPGANRIEAQRSTTRLELRMPQVLERLRRRLGLSGRLLGRGARLLVRREPRAGALCAPDAHLVKAMLPTR